MKTSHDYIGKVPFEIHYLSECLKSDKELLKFLEDFKTESEKATEIKAKTIEFLKENITKLTKQIKNL